MRDASHSEACKMMWRIPKWIRIPQQYENRIKMHSPWIITHRFGLDMRVLRVTLCSDGMFRANQLPRLKGHVPIYL